MTTATPSAATYQSAAPINSFHNDHTTESGVRVSSPIYLDIPMASRKALLNGVRCAADQLAVSAPPSASGIKVESTTNRRREVEFFLGMSLDVLRTALFQRGGLSVDLVMKLQAVSGIEVVSEKEINAAFKAKQTVVKDFISSYPFPYTPATQG